MRRNLGILFTVGILWTFQFVNAQCPDFEVYFGGEAIIFTTQDDIDSFRIKYPDCDSVHGTILIADPQYEIKNLKGLSNLRYVQELYVFSAPLLVDLQGLEDLEKVDILRLNRCYKLENLDHIADLIISERLLITSVDNLGSIGGMSQVDSLEQLFISNTGLDTLYLTGLQNLKYIHELRLSGKFKSPGLNSVNRVNELYISDGGFNDLHMLFGLIVNVDMDFDVISATHLDTFSIEGLKSVKSVDKLVFRGIQQLDLREIESYKDSVLELEISNCWELLNVNALDSLHVRTSVLLNTIGKVLKFPGFGITKGPQRITCRNLSDLIDITAMELWGNLERAVLENNPSLAICHNRKLCELIADSSAIIRNNAPGCISLDEVREQCLTNVQAEKFFEDVVVYPNPVGEMIHLSSWDHESGSIRYRIYDVIGNTRMNGTFRGDHILLDGLASGYYILQLEKEGYVRSFTFVKE